MSINLITAMRFCITIFLIVACVLNLSYAAEAENPSSILPDENTASDAKAGDDITSDNNDAVVNENDVEGEEEEDYEPDEEGEGDEEDDEEGDEDEYEDEEDDEYEEENTEEE